MVMNVLRTYLATRITTAQHALEPIPSTDNNAYPVMQGATV